MNDEQYRDTQHVHESIDDTLKIVRPIRDTEDISVVDKKLIKESQMMVELFSDTIGFISNIREGLLKNIKIKLNPKVLWFRLSKLKIYFVLLITVRNN